MHKLFIKTQKNQTWAVEAVLEEARDSGRSGWTGSEALFVMFTGASESPLDVLVFWALPRFFFLFFFRKLPASWLLDIHVHNNTDWRHHHNSVQSNIL